jgi:cation transport ATPase
MLLKGTEVDMGTLDMIGIVASQLLSTAYLASMATIILCVKWSNIVKQLRDDRKLEAITREYIRRDGSARHIEDEMCY